jgi:hypothetical protein
MTPSPCITNSRHRRKDRAVNKARRAGGRKKKHTERKGENKGDRKKHNKNCNKNTLLKKIPVGL